ncbi:MAG: helix-turn-helix transcriptional regulator [Promethearchaeota archaeon]|nr:MAG: helix-turn-helix transcriptional regulator [Candidatus Lokiarchaeota archaeon]
MVENYHKNFEKVLKKNFTNIFVLTILEKEPSHGYKIGIEIEKRTLGMWKPSASTLYWILNNLKEKGFIRLFKEDKNKKIYQITDTGRETLRLMKITQRKIRKSYRRFLTTSIVNNGTVDEEELEHFNDVPSIQMLPTALRPDKFNGDLTLSERLNILEIQRASIIENRDRMNDYIKDFDKAILKIKKELDNEE